jgi:hypothetical protein
MTEQVNSLEAKKSHKLHYVLWMLASFIWYALSLLDPSVRGPKLWVIFSCSAIASSVAALKLRNLIHGSGWVFPRTNTILTWVVAVETLLFLWFSH